ncbi:MAG: HAMP domain-containing histidine kinase [Elusimicrobia bacterium]|nr:HAMP domain-containing histidine kinase [Elusimicrobiota bacterium]
MTIRAKLTFTIAALLSAGLGALGLGLIKLERDHLLTDNEDRVGLVSRAVERAARDALLQKDDLLLVSYLKFLQEQHPPFLYCRVDWVNPDRSRTLRVGPAPNAARVEEQLVRVVDPADSQRSVTLTVGINRDKLDERVVEGVARLERDLLRVFGIAMVLVLILSDWFARSIARPIRKLSEAVVEVGRGRFGTRMEWAAQDEVGQLVAGFNQMSQRLEELDSMKRDFVSSVTHELRSPLGAIESFLRLIEGKMHSGRPQDPQQLQEYLGRIAVNVRRLSGFINDLLDVAKIERGKMECVLRPVRIQDVAKEVVQFFEAKSKEQQIGLTSKLDASLPLVNADPERIRQVLVNLVSNAMKFTPAGGQVWVAGEQFREGAKRWLEITVTDTGRGMDQADVDSLFKAFQQGKNVNNGVIGAHKGTGLGLVIVKSIAEAHGGKVGVRSAVGKGTQFSFTLALAQ